MSLNYAFHELRFRRGRSLVTIASVAVAVLATVLLTALASSYARAVRAPVETVGADMVVQLTGDIPPKLEGLVFPHPNALLPANVVAAVAKLDGVISVTRGVYMWELAPDHYQSIIGLEDGESGLGSLATRLIEGKPLKPADDAVVLDSDFAAKNGIKAGAAIEIGGTAFPVAGVVDAARGGKVARADVYMPLRPAQELAAGAPMVQALYPFRRDDVNLLLVKVDRQRLEDVVAGTAALLGKKGIISSELSFREALSGVMFLSQRMGAIVAAVIGLFAVAFVFRATASTVQERRRDLAVLQAIGWPWPRIRNQVLVENAILALAGVTVGLLLAVAIAITLGGVTVTIDLPWDLSSTPHFIPDATLDRTQTVTVPIDVPWLTAAAAAVGALAISVVAAWAMAARAPTQPWTLLRSE